MAQSAAAIDDNTKDTTSKGCAEAEVIIARCLNTHTDMCVSINENIFGSGVQHTPTSDYYCFNPGVTPKLTDIKDAAENSKHLMITYAIK